LKPILFILEVDEMRISRNLYAIAAWAFVVGVAVQVFLVGMTVVAGQWGWAGHINLGHLLAVPLLVMVVTVFTGKYPTSMKRLTLLLFGVYVLQADVLIFLRVSVPVLSALHPVLALVDFALGALLARRAQALRQEPVVNAAPEIA
jgi:hypothetical protein